LAGLPTFNNSRESRRKTVRRWRETAARSLLRDGVDVQAQALHQRIVQLATNERLLGYIPDQPLPTLHGALRQWISAEWPKVLAADKLAAVANSTAHRDPSAAAAPDAPPIRTARIDHDARASRPTPAGSRLPADAANLDALAAATVLSAGIRGGNGPPIPARVHPQGVQRVLGTVRQRELSPNLRRDEQPPPRKKPTKEASPFFPCPAGYYNCN